MLVVARTPAEKDLAAQILLKEIGVQPCADMRAMFWVDQEAGRIDWIVGYTGFIGKVCQMHMVNFKAGFTPRGLIHAAFDYPFNQLGLHSVLGVVNSKNEQAMRYDTKLGFKEVLRMPGSHDDGGDLVLLKMDRAQCRWIKEKQDEERMVA